MGPSGLAFYYGDMFSGWNGNLFAGSLLRQEIYLFKPVMHYK